MTLLPDLSNATTIPSGWAMWQARGGERGSGYGCMHAWLFGGTAPEAAATQRSGAGAPAAAPPGRAPPRRPRQLCGPPSLPPALLRTQPDVRGTDPPPPQGPWLPQLQRPQISLHPLYSSLQTPVTHTGRHLGRRPPAVDVLRVHAASAADAAADNLQELGAGVCLCVRGVYGSVLNGLGLQELGTGGVERVTMGFSKPWASPAPRACIKQEGAARLPLPARPRSSRPTHSPLPTTPLPAAPPAGYSMPPPPPTADPPGRPAGGEPVRRRGADQPDAVGRVRPAVPLELAQVPGAIRT